MDPSAIRAPGGERWLKRAEQVTDAFGLVLGLVILTFILTSLIDNSGWGSVVIMLATGATAIVALTSSHSPPHHVHIAIYLSALSFLLAIVTAISGSHLWLIRRDHPGRPAGRGDGRGTDPSGHHGRGERPHDPRRDQRLHRPRPALRLRLRAVRG